MALNFEKINSEGNRFMKELCIDLDCDQDRDKGTRILRAVLHTLRDHLTMEESLQLLAQLPLFLKALYVEGWNNKTKKKIKHIEDFLLEVWNHDRMLADKDFGNGQRTLDDVMVVFQLLRNYVSEGEMEDIASILPSEIKVLVSRRLSL